MTKDSTAMLELAQNVVILRQRIARVEFLSALPAKSLMDAVWTSMADATDVNKEEE